MDDQIYLTATQLADRWSVSLRTLESRRRYALPPQPVRQGRRVLYRVSDIEALEALEYQRVRTELIERLRRENPVGGGMV